MSAAAAAGGRRPGNADTRGEIVEAAKRVFAAKGYDGASLRAVAREAGVDPALVHHYFDGKASLFVAAMALPFDPRAVQKHEQSGSSTTPRDDGHHELSHDVGPRRRNGLLVRRLCRGDGGIGERGRRDARVRRRTGLGQQPGQRRREREHDPPTAGPRVLAADGTRLHALHPAGSPGLDGDAGGDRPLGRRRPWTATWWDRSIKSRSANTLRAGRRPFCPRWPQPPAPRSRRDRQPPAALSNEEIADQLDRAFRQMAAAEGTIVVLLGEVSRRQAYRDEGATSVEPWAVERFGVSIAERPGADPCGREGLGPAPPGRLAVRGRGVLGQGQGRGRGGHPRDRPRARATRPRSARCESWPRSPAQRLAPSRQPTEPLRARSALLALQRAVPHHERAAAPRVLRRDPGLPRGPGAPGPLRRGDPVGPAPL